MAYLNGKKIYGASIDYFEKDNGENGGVRDDINTLVGSTNHMVIEDKICKSSDEVTISVLPMLLRRFKTVLAARRNTTEE